MPRRHKDTEVFEEAILLCHARNFLSGVSKCRDSRYRLAVVAKRVETRE